MRLHFDPRLEGLNFYLGEIELRPVSFSSNKWYDIKLSFDCDEGVYAFWLNGEKIYDEIDFDIEIKTLERIVFRTGSWRSDVRLYLLDGEPDAPGMHSEDPASADNNVSKSTFRMDNVKTTAH